jgi:hypothetical protein
MVQPSPFRELATGSSIRLLRIASISNDSSKNITCFFDEVDLASWQGECLFTAVSYTWGSEDDSKNIMLNGAPVVVRRNLYDFLLQARQEGWHTHLWIDALCINQSNNLEKSRQVAMMGEIFSRAQQVLVWLGPLDLVESESLVEFHGRCKTSGINTFDRDPMRPSWDGGLPSRRSFFGYALDFMELPERCRRGIVRVLLNPYWRRKWIIQELFLAGPTACIVTCDWLYPTISITELARGFHYLIKDLQGLTGRLESLVANPNKSLQETSDMNELRTLIELLGYTKVTWSNIWIYGLENDVVYFWEVLADAKMTYKPQSFMQLVDAYRLHLCNDPRDNIYALLGISDLQPGVLTVDYSCTIQDLYNNVWSLVKDNLGGHKEDCLKRAMGLPNKHPRQ